MESSPFLATPGGKRSLSSFNKKKTCTVRNVSSVKRSKRIQQMMKVKEKLKKLNKCSTERCKVTPKELNFIKKNSKTEFHIPNKKKIPICGPEIPTYDELDNRIKLKLEAEEAQLYGYDLKKARSRRSQKNGLRQDQIEMMKPIELAIALKNHGVETGPIESGTIFLYQRKLLHLESKGMRRWRIDMPTFTLLKRKKVEPDPETEPHVCPPCVVKQEDWTKGTFARFMMDHVFPPVKRFFKHLTCDLFGVKRGDTLPYLPRSMGGGFHENDCFERCPDTETNECEPKKKYLSEKSEIVVFLLCLFVVAFIVFNGEPSLVLLKSHFSKASQSKFFSDKFKY